MAAPTPEPGSCCLACQQRESNALLKMGVGPLRHPGNWEPRPAHAAQQVAPRPANPSIAASFRTLASCRMSTGSEVGHSVPRNTSHTEALV